METSVLQPDDFQVGMFITVKDLKNKPAELTEEEVMSMPIQVMSMIQSGGPPSGDAQLETLKGAVIRIEAINLPYLIGTIYENAGRPGKIPAFQSAPLDVRKLEFMKVNEEYVKAYLGESSLVTLLQNKKFNKIQNIEGYDNVAKILVELQKKIEKEADDEASETAKKEENKNED